MKQLIKMAAKATALWLTEVADEFRKAVAAEREPIIVAEAHKRHSGEGWSIHVYGCPICDHEAAEAAGRC